MNIYKIFLKIFSKIFQEYFKNISQKIITKAIKKQVCVACVILFAFNKVQVRSNYFYNNLNLGLKNILLQCHHFLLVTTYKFFFEFKTFFKHNDFACKACFDKCFQLLQQKPPFYRCFLPFYLPFLDFFVSILFFINLFGHLSHSITSNPQKLCYHSKHIDMF